MDPSEEFCLVEVEETVGAVLDEDGQQIVDLLAWREGVDCLSESLQLGRAQI
jgi:hypothetical protein